MIKALRITSILAIILACGFLACPFFFGSRSDPKAEEFLKTADAAEKFNKAKTQKASKTDAKVSPLVKQAQAFSLYLNPPPKPEPTPENSEAGPSPFQRPTITPKFTLIGTSIHPDKPELSLALIDEPGKGLYWVKQAGTVGHLTIEQIKDGVITVGDGGKTSTLAVERPEKVSLLRNPPQNTSIATSPAVDTDQTPTDINDSITPLPTTDDEILVEEIFRELDAIERQVNQGLIDPNTTAEKSAAIIEKHMSEIETKRTRISTEEARDIDLLGSQLQAQKEGNSVPETTKKQQNITEKMQNKSKDATKAKPLPRQRDPRRRVIRRPRRDANSTQ